MLMLWFFDQHLYEAEHSAWRVAHAEELEVHDAEHTNGPIL